MNKLTNYTRLLGVLIVAGIAIVLQFILNQPLYAQILISSVGSLIALLMFIDMVKNIAFREIWR